MTRTTLPPADDRYTNSIPDLTELHDIVKQMRSNAAPGPDGLNAAFYKSAWSWIQQDVHNLVTEFYTSATSLLRLIKPTLLSSLKRINRLYLRILDPLAFAMSVIK